MSRFLIVLTSVSLVACGAKTSVYTGPDPCRGGNAALSDKLGPELSDVALTAPLGRPDMCALVYLRVAEESAEELPDDESVESATDHLLAVASVSKAGTIELQTLGRSSAAPGPVNIKLKMKNLYGSAGAEFIVEERAKSKDHALGFRGLRIFEVADRSVREVLSRRLLIKTAEGLTVVPLWGATNGPEGPRIVFDAAGTKEIYSYNKALKRFALDRSATAAANPKPEPPPAPATPAEAGTTPAEAGTAPPSTASPKTPASTTPAEPAPF